jgi:hypothetical protein
VIISKYDTANIKEYGNVGNVETMFDGDKQQDAVIIDKGTTTTSDSSPMNMEPVIKDEPETIKKDDDDFGFLNKPETYEMMRQPVVEQIAGFTSGPQKIKSTYELKYEDDNQFSFLIDTPAIQRIRQENKEDFQDKALQDNRSSSFILEDDIHEFFRNLPD